MEEEIAPLWLSVLPSSVGDKMSRMQAGQQWDILESLRFRGLVAAIFGGVEQFSKPGNQIQSKGTCKNEQIVMEC